MVSTSVVRGGIALAEVVGLDLGGITTQPLPVDLVKIVGLEDEARNHTLADRGLDCHIDLAEEDVLVGANRRGISLLVDGEDGTILGIIDRGAIERLEDITLALREVNFDGTAESRIIRARWSEG